MTTQALADRAQIFDAMDASDWSDETSRIVLAIMATAANRETFTANHVRAHLGEVADRHRIGRAFVLCAERGWIKPTGRFVRSDARTTRGARVAEWRQG